MMSTRSSALRWPSWRRNTLTICSRLLERLPPFGFSLLKSRGAVDTLVVTPSRELMAVAAALAGHAERRAAAAGGRRIGVPDGKAATGHGVDEVHFRALEVADADRVHEQLHAIRLVDLVTGAAALLDHQAVLEARAAAALHEHTQAAADLAFLVEQLVDLLGCVWGHVDHCYPLLIKLLGIPFNYTPTVRLEAWGPKPGAWARVFQAPITANSAADAFSTSA